LVVGAVDVVATTALIVGGALLRTPGLAPPSLWRDDTWVALVHKASPAEAIRMGLTSPGFSAIMRAWFGLVGFSELRAQLPAFLAGIAAPVALYFLARRIGLRRITALLAAVLLATAQPFVDVSVRVKQYSYEALAGVVLMWLAWEVVTRPESPRRWYALAAGSVVLTTISTAVSPLVAGALAAAVLAAAAKGVLRRRHVAIALGAVAAFALIWWLVVVHPASSNRVLRIFYDGAYIKASPGHPTWYSAYTRVGDVFTHFLPFGTKPVGPVMVLAIEAAIVLLVRRRILAVLVLTPLAIAIVLAWLRVAPLGSGSVALVTGSRTDVYLYSALALLLAAGVEQTVSLLSRGAAPVVAAFAVVVLVASATSTKYPAEDTKPLVQQLERLARPSDAIVVHSDSRLPFALYTTWPTEIVFTHRDPIGFTVSVRRRYLDVQGGGSGEDGHSDEAVWGLVQPHPRPKPLPDRPRVFILGSHFYTNPLALENALKDAGYQRRWDKETPGATLQLWEK
jgi:hypothetical protein